VFSGQPGVGTPDPSQPLELTVRVPYDEPIDDAEGLRKATVKLAQRAREIPGKC
jgi:hypothetical protein